MTQQGQGQGAELNFDANQVKPADTFEPVPTAWYPVLITESETKATKDNTGAYLQLKVVIQGGDYDKRVAWARLNLQNSNPVAVEIAQRQLSSICHAVGVLQVRHSSQLHGRPLMARIVYKPEVKDDQGNVKYEAGNDIKGFKAMEGGQGASPGATSGAPSWANDTNAAAPPAGGAAPGTVSPPPEGAPAPVVPQPSSPPAPEVPVPAPAPAPTGPIMTAKANGLTYDAFIAKGWSDDQLIEHGYMEPMPNDASAAPPADTAPTGKPPWAQ